MKIKSALALLLVAALATMVLGCAPNVLGDNKITGGGWSYDVMTANPNQDYPGNKVTFGFNWQPLSTYAYRWQEVEGNIQLKDHSQNIAIHGTSKLDKEINFYIEYIDHPAPGWTYWELMAFDITVNGEGGYRLDAFIYFFNEEFESVWILVTPAGSVNADYQWLLEELQGGNIKVHKK